MKQRLNVSTVAPDLYAAVLALDTAVKNSGIDANLLHLIKLRASQINGCAYCVDMHVASPLQMEFRRKSCISSLSGANPRSSMSGSAQSSNGLKALP